MAVMYEVWNVGAEGSTNRVHRSRRKERKRVKSGNQNVDSEDGGRVGESRNEVRERNHICIEW